PESVTSQLRTVTRRLEELARIDESVQEVTAQLSPAGIAVDEAAHALRHYLGKLEADPARLEEIETRMAALEKLKRKYGATVEEVLAFCAGVARNLAIVETSGERQVALGGEVATLAAGYEALSRGLTATRKTATQKLSRRVETELASLAMEN